MSSTQNDTNLPTSNGKQRAAIIGAVVILVLLIVGVVLAVIAMAQNPDQTETIRDIVIIFMALESLVIGLTLIILIVQIARLTALLENEIGPILNSTSDTVDTLRGTTTFLSNNLVRPVIKFNSTIAAIRQALGLVGIGRSNTND
jgi:ABC-type spermidine/putrescine transport system permease subunit II